MIVKTKVIGNLRVIWETDDDQIDYGYLRVPMLNGRIMRQCLNDREVEELYKPFSLLRRFIARFV